MFIDTESTLFGRSRQPYPEGVWLYRSGMRKPSRNVLWENIVKLMVRNYGKENLGKLAEEAGFAPSTSTRLRQQQTSVGLDVVDEIAKAFKLEPWQLLVPDLDIESPPDLRERSWPLPMVDKARYESLSAEGRAMVQGYMRKAIDDQAASETERERKSTPRQSSLSSV